MSWYADDKLQQIERAQRQELEALKEIIRKQDRQIALLEGILRSLENQKDIWGRSDADY